ncbi:MAG: hotdog fold domain-containing protein [bacterium]
MHPTIFRFFLNIYPPFWGTGISVKRISRDYREVVVEMKLRFYNRNYVKTHFGGSLYAMTDPFYMLMLMQILGKNYIVWDKSAQIDFIKPGRGTVRAHFVITDEQIEDILKNTENGQKYLPVFRVDIKDDRDEIVAIVKKTLYVKKKDNVAGDVQ